MSVNIKAQATVKPTEDPAKVQRALLNIFPSGSVQRSETNDRTVVLTVHGTGLDFLAGLKNLIRQDRIRSAARSILFRRAKGSIFRFYLNKQAAFVGRVSFCEAVGESPLGPISVQIEAANPELILDYLASRPGDQGFVRFQDQT
jgi:predicted RNA binding protein with dsRBD fold (UPF0201 family)